MSTEKLNFFENSDRKEECNKFKNLSLEMSDGGEPSITDGNRWLMTWRAREIGGYANIDKEGQSGTAHESSIWISVILDNEIKLMKERIKKYNNEGYTYDCKDITSIEKFVSYYCGMENVFKTTLNSLRNSVCVCCVRLKILKPEDIIEFSECDMLNCFIILLTKYVLNQVSSYDNCKVKMEVIFSKILGSIDKGDKKYYDFLFK